jgi:hypothetical protein
LDETNEDDNFFFLFFFIVAPQVRRSDKYRYGYAAVGGACLPCSVRCFSVGFVEAGEARRRATVVVVVVEAGLSGLDFCPIIVRFFFTHSH